MLLPYSGELFITFVGIFCFVIPGLFFWNKKSSLKTYQEVLWNGVVQSHHALVQEAHALTNHTHLSVDYHWLQAKSKLRKALNKCLAGYCVGFLFIFLSVLSSAMFLFELFLLIMAFIYASHPNSMMTDMMLITGEIVLVTTIIIEIFCFAIRKDIERLSVVVFHTLFMTFVAIIAGVVWTLCNYYPSTVNPDIAIVVYYLYPFLPLSLLVICGFHTCFMYYALLWRFRKLKIAIENFSEIEN